MIYPIIQDFFVHNAYVLEITASIALYCHFFKKRELFWLRFIGWIVLLFGLSMLWNVWKDDYAGLNWALVTYNIIKYVVAFVLGFWGILFCMETTRGGAFFSMICAVATQHLSYRTYAIILAAAHLGYNSIASFFIILSVMIAVYLSMYFIIVRKVKNQPEQCFENKTNILLGGIMILFTIILQFLLEPLVPMLENPILFIFISLYDIICCVFTLLLEYGLFRNKLLVNDKEILEHLVRKQEEQYKSSKANVEIINIKCHDMKHQISRMADRVDPSAIKELKDIINIYDATIKTGNEILDVFLMEKKLFCEQNDIKLDCIVNGECLSFMPASDIFSLFGNAIDNSIEALMKIEDTEKRIIGMTVKTQMGMIIIHCENYYQGELDFEYGFPNTTKDDKNYHGYGMRSIQMVAEKYNGYVGILAQDGIFNLNITIPMPD